MASAQKKASRTTNEAAVGQYIHAGGKIGVLVELNCESDFVARHRRFQELLKDIAMHIAATDPATSVARTSPRRTSCARRMSIAPRAAATGKPAPVIEKIVEGKMTKFYEEVCLLEQPFIKEQSVSIKEHIAQKVGKLGEKHHGAEIRPLQSRRPQLDRRPNQAGRRILCLRVTNQWVPHICPSLADVGLQDAQICGFGRHGINARSPNPTQSPALPPGFCFPWMFDAPISFRIKPQIRRRP